MVTAADSAEGNADTITAAAAAVWTATVTT